MNDRFNIRYFNKNSKKFEYLKIGAVNFNLFTDWTVYEQGQFCTGLKDKNGKLIYEGDIVEIKNEIFFIKYEIGSFLIIRNQQSIDAWYEMFTEAWNDDVYPLSQLYVDEYIQEEYIDCIEVIGNIYENKELLEEE